MDKSRICLVVQEPQSEDPIHAYLEIEAFLAGLQAVLDMSLKAGATNTQT